MTKLRFSDGMEIDTSGEYRVTRKSDGYYVVGHGMCCPVNDREEGEEMIKYLKKKEEGA